jgi:hydroxyquinol 1,2-dioxygenase
MRKQAPAQISAEVVRSFSDCPDARLEDLMKALVRHLHAFVEDVRLTRQEWAKAMDVLAESGRFTTPTRHEFVLWSDVLGISMLVDALDNASDPAATESTVEGPFWAAGSPHRDYGASISERAEGIPLWFHGRVLDVAGRPIAKAVLDVWQNGPDQLYAVQDSTAPENHLRGKFETGEDGAYAFLALRPTPYPIPDDGPVGAMLRRTGREPWRPAHIHVAISADGYRPVVTHIFDSASDHLDSDAVFAVKPSLIKEFTEHPATDPARPRGIDEPWASVEVDFVLAELAQAQPV